jgi:hypothetical protein
VKVILSITSQVIDFARGAAEQYLPSGDRLPAGVYSPSAPFELFPALTSSAPTPLDRWMDREYVGVAAPVDDLPRALFPGPTPPQLGPPPKDIQAR